MKKINKKLWNSQFANLKQEPCHYPLHVNMCLNIYISDDGKELIIKNNFIYYLMVIPLIPLGLIIVSVMEGVPSAWKMFTRDIVDYHIVEPTYESIEKFIEIV